MLRCLRPRVYKLIQNWLGTSPRKGGILAKTYKSEVVCSLYPMQKGIQNEIIVKSKAATAKRHNGKKLKRIGWNVKSNKTICSRYKTRQISGPILKV